MDRRDFVKAGLAAGALGSSPLVAQAASSAHVPDDDRHWYELRIYETRSDLAPDRFRNFLRDQMLPALQRAGTGPVGVFQSDIGMLGQSLLLFIDHRTAADALGLPQRLAVDERYAAALRTLEADPQPPYVRYESRLMRAFPGHPKVEVPPGDVSRPPRLLELRTYESRNADTLARKIDMFSSAEIGIFRAAGMLPVFFGENLFASRLPSLTYMVAFDDMAARNRAWGAFGRSPDWQRLQKDARYDVPGITTTTSADFLSPLPFSQIR